MFTDMEKKVICLLQKDIPVSPRPYKEMADQLGITEDKFLEIVKDLDRRGLIRRFGVTLKHQKSGFTANAMVAWNIPEDRVQTVGPIMAGFDQITHCYRRDPAPGWKYNMYTMVHGASREQCREFVKEIAQAVNETDYTILFSVRELKKTSMMYFQEDF